MNKFLISGLIILVTGCSEKDKNTFHKVIDTISKSCSADIVKTGSCERTVKTGIGTYNIIITKK